MWYNITVEIEQTTETDYQSFVEQPIEVKPRNIHELTGRERSLANLRRFPPGNNANPKGRPKKENTISSILQDLLKQKDKATGKTQAQLIAEAMLKQALHNPQVLKEVLERCEGKVTESVDMRTTGVSILYELVKPDATK